MLSAIGDVHFPRVLLKQEQASSLCLASHHHLEMTEDGRPGGMVFAPAQTLVAGVWLALVWPSPMQLGSSSQLRPAVTPHQPTH